MTESQGKKRRSAELGFTLVELMVVITIIAILATIVGVNLLSSLDDAHVAAAKAQIRVFKDALMTYRLKLNRFPSSSEGLQALCSNEKGIKFLDSNDVPKDPWGNPYVYTSDSNREYKIVSYGADGKPGGSGYDSDIDSSALESESR